MPAELAVFISHSSDDNPLVRELVAKLGPALSKVWEGAELMVDYHEIKPGQDWRDRIDTMMWRCNAALFLMTPSVMARPPQVLHEANVISFLFRSDRQYKLWIARTAGVSRDDIDKGGFAPARLKTVQHLAQELNSANLDALVIEICDSLGALKQSRGEPDDVTEHLKQELQQDATGNLCRELAKRLDYLVPASWGPEMGAAVAAATAREAVHRRQLDLAIDSLLGGLHVATDERRHRLLRYLAPLWVRRGAAARLRAYAPEGKNKSAGAVAIKGDKVYDFTAKMHVERAFGPTDEGYRLHRVPIAQGGVTFDGVRASVCAWWRSDDSDYAALEDAQIVERLATDQNEPVFVLMQYMPDAQVRDQLRDEFPRMLFVAPVPNVDPADGALVELELDSGQNLADYLSIEKRERDGWQKLRPKSQKT